MDKRIILRNLGVEENDISHGNIGFEIEDLESYFVREHMENQLSEGFDVPEDFIPRYKSQHERDLYRWTKQMERLEKTRTEYDDKRNGSWTWNDEFEWTKHLKDKGYGSYLEDRVVGSIDIPKLLNKEDSKEVFRSRWLAAKIGKK